MDATLTGDLRRLPPSTGLRILQAISLWMLVKGVGRLFGTYALGYRHRFTLTLVNRDLQIDQTRALWGFPFRTSRTLLPLDQLQEITLERSGESPGFGAGLAALIVGSFLGARFFTEGVAAPGGAPWLLGLGVLFVVLGLALDFFVGSGRTVKAYEGSPQLVIRVRGDRGFVLAGLTRPEAESVLEAVKVSLSTGGPLTAAQASPPADSPEPAQ